jgi:4-amino-4-deoxy-L-arabinose transferase-like glycosyltransferase
VAAAALALALQGLLFVIDAWPAPRALWGDEIMYADLARRLAAGEDARIDFLWPPAYPRFLAGLLVLGGGSFVLARCVQVALLALSALLLRDLGLRLLGWPLAADVAAALVVLDPQVAGFAHFLWPEVLHLFLFLSALWILVARGDRPPWLAVGGVVLGLALLTKGLLGPFLPVLLLPLVFRGGLRGLGRAVLVGAALAATVAPTLLANARRGAPVISDSSRFNLWVGLNDRSRKDLVNEVVGREHQRYLRSGETFAERTAVLEEKIERLVRERGLLALLRAQLGRQYFRLLDKDSFVTDQLPGGAIARQGYGYRETPPWVAALLRAWSYGLYAAVLVAAALGLAVDPPRGRPWHRVLLAFLAYNAALFLLLHVKSRYRVAFLPILYLEAGAFAAWWHGARGTAAAPSRVVWAAAGAAASVALFLAFAGPLFR